MLYAQCPLTAGALVGLGVVIAGAYILSQQGEAVPEQVNADDVYLPGGTLSQKESGAQSRAKAAGSLTIQNQDDD